HVRDERDATGDEAPLGFPSPGNLIEVLWGKRSPYVAHVHADFLEYLASHQARGAAALQAMPFGPGPGARHEATRGLERLEGCADPVLQIEAEARHLLGNGIRLRCHRDWPG